MLLAMAIFRDAFVCRRDAIRGHASVSSESIEWKPGPVAIPPGAKMAVLEGDPTKEGPFVVRFQFPEAIMSHHIRIQKLSASL